ncbi:PIG-L family deacetylase [Paenarthrobacter sp. Z7-10]|uniref:PIG-L family deacetylase n=1 Tax=Paenarthrobacter sp. Z7-10 TaxID=2787635 RepID=UPI0022A973CB|nr:PIG-L family deacetylase [Paenarthrobacter sp. Z7-10]MCZ2404517.1 PIG-L family deacetylase [Paenarthrobacter sp. Z7-10]
MTFQQPAPLIPRGGLLSFTPGSLDNPHGVPRLLFIHAHPDDETITTGASMAHYAALGAQVAVLTCTRGELGEVIPPQLRHLQVGQPGNDDDGAALAAVRESELAVALEELGVRRHYWLGSGQAKAGSGADVLYRDSGMSWGPNGRAQPAETMLEGSLCRAPLAEEAAHAAALIRTLRPDVVVTYAADGGYGHPDHVRTHELTMQALKLAAAAPADGLPAWEVPVVYTIVSDRPESPSDPDAKRTVVQGETTAKSAAMRAHRTQISVDADASHYALSDGVWKDLSGWESFHLIKASGMGDPDPADWRTPGPRTVDAGAEGTNAADSGTVGGGAEGPGVADPREVAGGAGDAGATDPREVAGGAGDAGATDSREVAGGAGDAGATDSRTVGGGAASAAEPGSSAPAAGGVRAPADTGAQSRPSSSDRYRSQAGGPRPTFSDKPARRLKSGAVAVAAGLLAGILGTALHGQTFYLQGWGLIWGAAAALLLLLSLAVLVGLWARSSWYPVLTGLAAYAVAGILAVSRGGSALIVGNLSGNVWLFGIAAMTPLAAIACALILHPRRSATR